MKENFKEFKLNTQMKKFFTNLAFLVSSDDFFNNNFQQNFKNDNFINEIRTVYHCIEFSQLNLNRCFLSLSLVYSNKNKCKDICNLREVWRTEFFHC